MLLVRGKVVSSGVDYITCSEVTNRDVEPGKLEEVWRKINEDGTGKKTRKGGYEGIQKGSVFYGERVRANLTDSILSVSGEEAATVFEKVGKELNAFRCTRIDLQSTVALTKRDGKLASDFFGELERSDSYRVAMIGRRQPVLHDSLEGQTLYIGKRSSKSLLIRVYDKGAQLGGETGVLWRFEIEYKTKLASAALASVLRLGKTDGLIAWAMEKEAGILLPIQHEGNYRLLAEKHKVDAMGWIEGCVRPVVSRLINDGCDLDELLDALGLSWVVDGELAMMREGGETEKGEQPGQI